MKKKELLSGLDEQNKLLKLENAHLKQVVNNLKKEIAVLSEREKKLVEQMKQNANGPICFDEIFKDRDSLSTKDSILQDFSSPGKDSLEEDSLSEGSSTAYSSRKNRNEDSRKKHASTRKTKMSSDIENIEN